MDCSPFLDKLTKPNTAGNGMVLNGPGRTYLPTPVTAAQGGGKAKSLFHVPNKKIMKAVGQAVLDWSMIEEGDRLLLGLSGGKDSLALLHILIALQVFTFIIGDMFCSCCRWFCGGIFLSVRFTHIPFVSVSLSTVETCTCEV